MLETITAQGLTGFTLHGAEFNFINKTTQLLPEAELHFLFTTSGNAWPIN